MDKHRRSNITALVFWLLALSSAIGAVPSFQSFDPADFSTNSYNIRLTAGVTNAMTNAVSGVLQTTNGAARLRFPENYSISSHPTPPRIWSMSNNNGYNDTNLMLLISVFKTNGMAAAGYIVAMDDSTWFYRSNGVIMLTNTWSQTPGYVADFAHTNGIKFGGYIDLNAVTSGGNPGSLNHYDEDALTYAGYKFDYAKFTPLAGSSQTSVDSMAYFMDKLAGYMSTNSAPPLFAYVLNNTTIGTESTRLPFTKFVGAWYSADCPGGCLDYNYTFPRFAAHFDSVMKMAPQTRIGMFPSMESALSGTSSDGLTKTLIGAITVTRSIMLVADPSPRMPDLTNFNYAYYTNASIIALQDNPLVVPPVPILMVVTNGVTNSVLVQPLFTMNGPAKAIFLLNRDVNNWVPTVKFSDLQGVSPIAMIYDPWGQTNIGWATNSYTVTVGPTNGVLLEVLGMGYTNVWPLTFTVANNAGSDALQLTLGNRVSDGVLGGNYLLGRDGNNGLFYITGTGSAGGTSVYFSHSGSSSSVGTPYAIFNGDGSAGFNTNNPHSKFQVNLTATIWTNDAPFGIILNPITLGTKFTNTTAGRATLWIGYTLVDAVGGTPTMVYSNFTTGEWFDFSTTASLSGNFTNTTPGFDLSPSDVIGFYDRSAGAGASVTVNKSILKVK